MQLDEVDYETDDWEDSIFCTKEEMHCTKVQIEKASKEMHCTTTHVKTWSSNGARSNNLHTVETLITHDDLDVSTKKQRNPKESGL